MRRERAAWRLDRWRAILGGEIASTFDHPELVKLGYCDLIEEIIVGEDKVGQRSMRLPAGAVPTVGGV